MGSHRRRPFRPFPTNSRHHPHSSSFPLEHTSIFFDADDSLSSTEFWNAYYSEDDSNAVDFALLQAVTPRHIPRPSSPTLVLSEEAVYGQSTPTRSSSEDAAIHPAPPIPSLREEDSDIPDGIIASRPLPPEPSAQRPALPTLEIPPPPPSRPPPDPPITQPARRRDARSSETESVLSLRTFLAETNARIPTTVSRHPNPQREAVDTLPALGDGSASAKHSFSAVPDTQTTAPQPPTAQLSAPSIYPDRMDAYDPNDPSALDDYFSWAPRPRGNLIPPIPNTHVTAAKHTHTHTHIPTLPAQHLVSPTLSHTPSELPTISELPEPDARARISRTGRIWKRTGAGTERMAKEDVKSRARRALLRPGVLKLLLGRRLAGPVREALKEAAGRGEGVAALVGAGTEMGVVGLDVSGSVGVGMVGGRL